MGFDTREEIENYIAANKSPGEFLFDGRCGRDRPIPTRQYARLVSYWIATSGWTRVSLGRIRCAEPRLPSSTAALVSDGGALGLGANIFHPRLFATRTCRGGSGSKGGGPALMRERQPRPRKPTIVQVKSIVFCVPFNRHSESSPMSILVDLRSL